MEKWVMQINNEPVAWIRQGEYGKPIIVQNPLHQFSYQAESAKWDDIPLYTHPAKTLTEDTECQYCKQGCIRCDARKLLTDEEILQKAWYILATKWQRKAQEKL